MSRERTPNSAINGADNGAVMARSETAEGRAVGLRHSPHQRWGGMAQNAPARARPEGKNGAINGAGNGAKIAAPDPHRVERARALLARGAEVSERQHGVMWLVIDGRTEMATSRAVVREARRPVELEL